MKKFDEEEFFDESLGIVERFGLATGYLARQKAVKIISVVVVVIAVVIFGVTIFLKAFLRGASKKK